MELESHCSCIAIVLLLLLVLTSCSCPASLFLSSLLFPLAKQRCCENNDRGNREGHLANIRSQEEGGVTTPHHHNNQDKTMNKNNSSGKSGTMLTADESDRGNREGHLADICIQEEGRSSQPHHHNNQDKTTNKNNSSGKNGTMLTSSMCLMLTHNIYWYHPRPRPLAMMLRGGFGDFFLFPRQWTGGVDSM
jgi:hypothetical protein